MPNWLRLRAVQDSVFHRDAAELWREIKNEVMSVVDLFNEVYCDRRRHEYEYNDCLQSSLDCIRVRWIPPPGERDRYIELRFRPEQRLIVRSQQTGEPLQFVIGFTEGTNTLDIIHVNRSVSVDEAIRIALESFLFEGGPRTPVNLVPS